MMVIKRIYLRLWGGGEGRRGKGVKKSDLARLVKSWVEAKNIVNSLSYFFFFVVVICCQESIK